MTNAISLFLALRQRLDCEKGRPPQGHPAGGSPRRTNEVTQAATCISPWNRSHESWYSRRSWLMRARLTLHFSATSVVELPAISALMIWRWRRPPLFAVQTLAQS